MLQQTRSGTTYELELTASPVRDRDGRIVSFVSVGRDVTRERALEDQLRQAQKMEAVGQLAGGIAHDFNNMLTAIQGYSELLLADLPDVDPRRDDVLEIRLAAERAASLTRQLLAFGRRTVLRPRTIDVNVVLAGVSRLLASLIGEDIVLRTDLAPGTLAVEADPGQLEQVIINLGVNARDAMPDGGTLTLATRCVVLDADQAAAQHGREPGEYVVISASDTGTGITPEVQARMFEPFYTTKEPGKGTGLGLSTVFGIVTMSGGDIGVESEPGHGATFTIHLPRSHAVPVAFEPERPESAAGGTEQVLVVEDDPGVRQLVASTLGGSGYAVRAAQSGAEALELIASSAVPLDLLITDVVMPGMTGAELARRLRELRPAVPVLYISGYTADALTDRHSLGPGIELLEKPFGPETLLRRVRAILDATAVGPA